MLCNYCNADLNPEDRICPVCGKPVGGISSMVNQDIGNIPNNINNIPEDVMEDLDKSIFEPLQPQGANVEESQVVEEQHVMNEEIPLVFADQSVVSDEPKIIEEQNSNMYNSIQPPVVENVVSSVSDNLNVSETKKHKRNMWMVPMILIIFLVIILGFVFYISRSSKMIFNNLINKTYKQINSSMIIDVKNIKGSMSLQTEISTTDESLNEIFEILNNIYLAADYEIDYENEEAFIKLNTKYNNEKLVDADVFLEDSKGYVLLKDVYSKYLSTDVDGFDEIFEEVEITDEHKIIVSEAKKALTKSLKSEYFTKEKVSIKINNENVSVVKNSLILNAEVVEKIKKDFLTYLKDNDKFIASLSDVTETDKDEILTSIEDELKTFDSEATYSNNTEVTMSIYTSGLMNNIVKMDLVVTSEGEKTTIEFTEESENNYSIVLNSAGSTINGSIKLLENNDETTKVEVSLTEPTSGTTIGLTIGMSVKYNTKLTNVDISNSVDVSTLTEEEANEIITKLLENKGIQNLMSAFGGISSGGLYDYEDKIICGDDAECYYGDELIY